MPKVEDICENCKHSFFYVNDNNELVEGLCHRYPPILIDHNGGSTFPEIFSDDWCGEFVNDEKTINKEIRRMKKSEKKS
jgi:hypothetical protein